MSTLSPFSEAYDDSSFSTFEIVSPVTNDLNSGTIATESGSESDNVSLAIYYTIGIIGILGNGIVIFVLSSSPKTRQKIVNVFLINQSILDFCTAVFLIATAKNDYEQDGHFGMSGELYCRLYSMKVPMWSTFMSSTYNLVALTLERYMEVNHPLKHRMSFTRSHAIAIIVIVWLIGPVYNFPLTGLTSTSRNGKCNHMTEWPNMSVQMFCGVLTFVLQFFLPLAIMITSYTKMAKALSNKVHPGGTNQPGSGQPAASSKMESQKMKARRNIIRTLILVALCFFFCWVWNQVFFLLFNLGHPSNFNTTFYDFTVYAAFVNCCINPFIYTAQYKDFQLQAKKLLRRSQSPSIETSANTINA